MREIFPRLLMLVGEIIFSLCRNYVEALKFYHITWYGYLTNYDDVDMGYQITFQY